MKKRFYIALTAIAMMLLLILPVVPHHHHDSVVCVAVEHCYGDDTDNDQHTAHDDDGTRCFERAAMVASFSKQLGVWSGKTIVPGLFVAVLSLQDFRLFFYATKPFKPYVITLHYMEKFCCKTLRAPPTFFLSIFM